MSFNLGGRHHVGQLVERNGAGEVGAAVAPVVQQGDADLVDLLDVDPRTAPDPAAHRLSPTAI